MTNVTMCAYEGKLPLSPIYKMDTSEEDGCFNENADKVERVDETWSDTNLVHEYPEGYKFKRLVCRNCRSNRFYVLSTNDYETSAKCCECGMYYIVHSG
jgi:hypothetical protein